MERKENKLINSEENKSGFITRVTEQKWERTWNKWQLMKKWKGARQKIEQWLW